MLTRLRVSGFKNLVDVDIHFGPFTCIAGANGVGKSNLFDAIQFLSSLADLPIVEAAQSVRAGEGRSGDIDTIFHRFGKESGSEISFYVEMVISAAGMSDLGQSIKARHTFLSYSLSIAKRINSLALGPLEIRREELIPLGAANASKCLAFPRSRKWERSAVIGKTKSLPLISTLVKGEDRTIRLRRESVSGHPLFLSGSSLPRTVLSSVTGEESPTIALVKREMQSWGVLHLDPAFLREPDKSSSPTVLSASGAHLAANLFQVASSGRVGADGKPTMDADQVYGQVANRLSELIHEVRRIWVDKDENRKLLTLMAEGRDRTPLPARALSDGTLRFLALAVLELDPRAQGLLCFEEPENGIHPERLLAMLRLLQDIAIDVNEPVDFENPLRQVIINTHSPAVVAQVPDESLLVAESGERVRDGKRFQGVSFSALPGTWREKVGSPSAARGDLMSYLNPFTLDEPGGESRRVVDREDFQRLLSL
ncbi:MAG TPA: AAA family ATPase [Thermoanaerobaculia bacterium]|jgi:predicted ATPase|nr:AAA family ATPase [Thermoanaerobaculia bacterium]